MLLELGGLVAAAKFVCDVNKSADLDGQAVRKNEKAFVTAADAKRKMEIHREDMEKALTVNAKRKMAILEFHLKKFQNTYDKIRVIRFKEGRGIAEVAEIEAIQTQLTRYVKTPLLADKINRSDPQLVFSIIRHGGLGGQFVADSHENLDVARKNLANANVVSAQADAICVAYDGISERAKMCTDLLQRLAAVYIKGINHVQVLLDKNGADESKYTDGDIDAINVCLLQTKLIYRIINTPLIDREGGLTAESLQVIDEGQHYLSKIL